MASPTKENTQPVSFRLSGEAIELLGLLSEALEVTKSNVIRLALRALARQERVGQWADDERAKKR